MTKLSSLKSKTPANPNSGEWVAAFKAAAQSYTAKTTRNQTTAVSALKKNGLLTKTGRLTTRYASK